VQQNIVPRPRTGEYLGGAGGLAGTGGFHADSLLRRPPKMLTGTGGDMSAPKIIEDRRLLKLCADGMLK